MKKEKETTETTEETKEAPEPKGKPKKDFEELKRKEMIKKVSYLKETVIRFVPATDPYLIATFSRVGVDISLKISIKNRELARDMIRLMSKNGLVSPEKIDICDPETRKRFSERAKELEWDTGRENIKEQFSICGVPKDLLGPIEEAVLGLLVIAKAAEGFSEEDIAEAISGMKE